MKIDELTELLKLSDIMVIHDSPYWAPITYLCNCVDVYCIDVYSKTKTASDRYFYFVRKNIKSYSNNELIPISSSFINNPLSDFFGADPDLYSVYAKFHLSHIYPRVQDIVVNIEALKIEEQRNVLTVGKLMIYFYNRIKLGIANDAISVRRLLHHEN